MRLAIIAGGWCDLQIIEKLSVLQVDGFIGLGDFECPNLLSNYLGLLGEKDGVFVKHFLDQGRYLRSAHGLSSDFTTNKWVSHMPPLGPTGLVGGFKVGDPTLLSLIEERKPSLLIHGHSEFHGEAIVGETRVVSVGPVNKGYLAFYYPLSEELVLSSLAMR
jgi:Predicted phosphoesterases, related to the Icc protein